MGRSGNGFQGLVRTVAVAYTNALALLLAFTLSGEARIDIIISAPPTSKTRRNAALHDQDVSKKSVPLTRYVLGIMQFKDWFCFSVCPSTVIAEGGHSEEAKVDAVRRCPYPPER